MTIVQAIQTVMRVRGEPMTAAEVYSEIARAKLYEFQTDNPASIIRAQIRRHCEELNLKSSSQAKHFKALADDRFELIHRS